MTNERNQSELNATFNKVFTINCSVKSYPPAIVHWEADGEQVINDTVVIADTIVHGVVTVDTSIPGAIITYTCVAVNVINGVDHFANNSVDVIIQGKMKISCQIAVNSMGNRMWGLETLEAMNIKMQPENIENIKQWHHVMRYSNIRNSQLS